MARYIDETLVNAKLKEICENTATTYGIVYGGRAEKFARLTKDIPTADVVEVVRCKNCAKKVDYKDRVMCSKNARVICGELCGLTATSDEHFCGYGKRINQ